MLSLIEFARTEGSKDKQPRKSHILRNAAIGLGAASALGGAALLAHKRLSAPGITPNPVHTSVQSSPQSSTPQSSNPQAPPKTGTLPRKAPVNEKTMANSERVQKRKNLLDSFDQENKSRVTDADRARGVKTPKSITQEARKANIDMWNKHSKAGQSDAKLAEIKKARVGLGAATKNAVHRLKSQGRYFSSAPRAYLSFSWN